MVKNRRSRINYSIKRQMQIRLFLKVLSVVLIGIGMMAIVFYFFSDRQIENSYRQFHIHARNFLDWLLPLIVISLFLGGASAASISIFFPHKIAGPLYRIENDLKDRVSGGDLTVRFRLRKGDEVKDLAEAINTMLDTLGGKIHLLKQSAQELESEVRKSGPGSGNIAGISAKINDTLREIKV